MNNAATTATVNVSFGLQAQWIEDLLTTAVEGGIGYWADIKRVSYGDGVVEILHEDLKGGGSERTVAVTLDGELIARGIALVLSGAMKIAPHIAGPILQALAEGECDLDIEAADVIVQAGVFGELVYG